MKSPLKACPAVLIVTFMAIGAVACPDPDRTPVAPDAVEEATPPAAPARAAPPTLDSDEDPSTVVAKIGDEEITLGQVEEDLAAELFQARMEHRQREYELRRAGIDRIIAQRLFSEEADRLGLDDEEEYVTQAVEKGTPFPSEDEARAFYEQNKQMMGGQTFEQIQQRVTEFLHQKKKQERFNTLLEGLREKADVTILLDEPRIDVEAKGQSKGPEDAPVTIVEFTDFVCPFCARGKEVMDRIGEEYGDQVRFVFRLFPTMNNEVSARAATAAVCAGLQDRFWKMHEALFSAGRALSPDDVMGYARAIEGIDMDEFEACMDSDEAREKIEGHIAAGRSVGVGGTPAFFVNGIPVLGAQPFETFKEIIDDELGRVQKRPVAAD